MTLREWLWSRPAAAPALSARMHAAAAAVESGGGPLEDRALRAALTLADDVLRDESGARTGAMALLAADALMTCAFEASADAPGRIDDLAAEAMRRVSAAAGHVA